MVEVFGNAAEPAGWKTMPPNPVYAEPPANVGLVNVLPLIVAVSDEELAIALPVGIDHRRVDRKTAAIRAGGVVLPVTLKLSVGSAAAGQVDACLCVGAGGGEGCCCRRCRSSCCRRPSR